MAETLLIFALGLISGLCCKGINIKINHHEKKPEIPTEPAPSSVKNLPPEMAEYAQKNHGFINF